MENEVENMMVENTTIKVKSFDDVNNNYVGTESSGDDSHAYYNLQGIINNIFNSFEIICIVVVCISLLIMFFNKNEKYKKIAIIFLALAILGLLFLLVLKVQAVPQVIVS